MSSCGGRSLPSLGSQQLMGVRLSSVLQQPNTRHSQLLYLQCGRWRWMWTALL